MGAVTTPNCRVEAWSPQTRAVVVAGVDHCVMPDQLRAAEIRADRWARSNIHLRGSLGVTVRRSGARCAMAEHGGLENVRWDLLNEGCTA